MKTAAAPTAAFSQATQGKNYKISLNTGSEATPDWTLIGGQRGGSLTMKADSIDASHKNSGGWKTTLQGLKEWSIELDTIVVANDDALNALRAAFKADQAVNIKYEYPDHSYVTGWATITEFSIDAPHDDVATCKGTLNGVSELVEGTGETV